MSNEKTTPKAPEAEPSSTPAGTTTGAASAEPTPKAPEPWRAGADSPEWARGKSAEEILGIAQNLVENFGRGTPVAERTGVAHDVQQPPAPATPGYDPEDYVKGSQLNEALKAALAQITPSLTQNAEQMASANYALVSRDDKYREVFTKYAPELQGLLVRVPKQNWTVDNLEMAAKLVRGNHVDELARDRARQLASEMETTIRSTGGGSAPVPASQNEASLKSDKLPADWRERAAKVGLDERTLDEFCFANDMTREQFFGQFSKTLVTQEIGKVRGL